MMKESLFVSRTAEVKSLITEFMEQSDEAVERKDIVNYVQAHVSEEVTDGVIAGAIKMMTASGEIFPVSRGVYVRGAGKRQTTVFERIYSVCKRFQGDLNRACTVNVLELNSEERYTYLKIIGVLDRLTGQVNSCVDDMELLIRMWVNPDGTLLGLQGLSIEDTEQEKGFDSIDSLMGAFDFDSFGSVEAFEDEDSQMEMGEKTSDDSSIHWDSIDEAIAKANKAMESESKSVGAGADSVGAENDTEEAGIKTEEVGVKTEETADDAEGKKPVTKKRGRKSKKSNNIM